MQSRQRARQAGGPRVSAFVSLYLWLYLRICSWNEFTLDTHTYTKTVVACNWPGQQMCATGSQKWKKKKQKKNEIKDSLEKVRQCNGKRFLLVSGCLKYHLKCGLGIKSKSENKTQELQRDLSHILILVAKDTQIQRERERDISVSLLSLQICVNVGESHNVNAHKNKSKGIFCCFCFVFGNNLNGKLKKCYEFHSLWTFCNATQRQKTKRTNASRSSFQLQRYFSSRVYMCMYLKKLCIINTSQVPFPHPLHTTPTHTAYKIHQSEVQLSIHLSSPYLTSPHLSRISDSFRFFTPHTPLHTVFSFQSFFLFSTTRESAPKVRC